MLAGTGVGVGVGPDPELEPSPAQPTRTKRIAERAKILRDGNSHDFINTLQPPVLQSRGGRPENLEAEIAAAGCRLPELLAGHTASL